MKISSWGKLKNKLDGLLEYLTALPGIVICNCHSKIQTMDTGGNKVLPYIDGSTKEDISKWFDFVLYATTINKPNGTNTYVWRTNHTSLYDHAKDRTQLLDNEIPQDYQVVLKAAKDRGYDGAKILVIGSPGTGKTFALRTLNPTTTKVKTTNTPKVTANVNGGGTDIPTTTTTV
jgi:Cdc6-like AAA superfamily ATPase